MSTAKRLYGEVGIVQRQVVLNLVEGQSRAAAARKVGHDHFVRGPDSLDLRIFDDCSRRTTSSFT